MLVMVLISLCIVITPFNLIPLNNVYSFVDELSSNWYYSIVGLFLLFFSLKLLLSGISSDTKSKMGIIKQGEQGDIRISIETFESLSLKVVKQISGVKDVKIKIALGEGDITVSARLLAVPDVNIPRVVSEVQNKIKNYIESITEVNVKEVKVSIDNIALTTTARVE
jgi:uncharacterized alkaline shock family protein YloU